jgi:DNA-binding CsgD family transcriptional regulator
MAPITSERAQRSEQELTDAVYRTVLEPAAWADVMALMRVHFPSSAQTFYFLDRDSGRVRPVCLAGIDRTWLTTFDALYFAPDNPWIQVSQRLHRPGVVRTNERLDAFLGRHGALYRSAYYHDWMRPQGLHHTLGSTLLAQGPTVANITLMRPADMPAFGADEVRVFEAVSRHMMRALQTSIRLEHEGDQAAKASALDALPYAVALVHDDLSLVYANPPMEALLRQRRGLCLQQGRLAAVDARAQRRLLVAHARGGWPPAAPDDAAVRLPLADGSGFLVADVLPVAQRAARYLPARPLTLVVVRRLPEADRERHDALVERYGCTRSEAALAVRLAHGVPLRAAADTMGLTYASARIYLKSVFRKLEVHSQAQLVAALARMSAGAAGGT